MKLRYLLLGGTAATVTALAVGLGVVGVQNINRETIIQQKKSDLDSIMYPVVPAESRSLSRPIGPAFPSPGYEN